MSEATVDVGVEVRGAARYDEAAAARARDAAHAVALNRVTAWRSIANRALWRKAFVDARLLLGSCVLLMFAFHWIFVWITSLVKLGPLADFITSLPAELRSLSGVPAEEVATVAGRIALCYVDPVVLFTAAVWAISRGSDAISGEIDRGTMEMLVSQPVSRMALLFTQVATTLGGALAIALASLGGTACGLAFVELEQPTALSTFYPSVTNLFAMTVFLCGVATAVSSFDRYRWRTIGLMGGYYTLSLIVNVMGRTVPSLNWLEYLTFFGVYEPQGMVSEMLRDPAKAWQMALHYNGILIGLGAVGYALAAVVFAKRDIPAPL